MPPRIGGARRRSLFISVRLPDPGAYGRVVRDPAGTVAAIVEARDASAAERAINEVNTGIYLADVRFLRTALAELQPNNAQGEFYLTDIIAIARKHGLPVEAWTGHPTPTNSWASIHARSWPGWRHRSVKRLTAA